MYGDIFNGYKPKGKDTVGLISQLRKHGIDPNSLKDNSTEGLEKALKEAKRLAQNPSVEHDEESTAYQTQTGDKEPAGNQQDDAEPMGFFTPEELKLASQDSSQYFFDQNLPSGKRQFSALAEIVSKAEKNPSNYRIGPGMTEDGGFTDQILGLYIKRKMKPSLETAIQQLYAT